MQVPGLGLVSYVVVWSMTGKVNLVSTDPLVAPRDMRALLELFHADVPGTKQ
jgi:hypothetical protein